MHRAQLHWASARTSYAALVEAEDAARAPHIKRVCYKRDGVIEWGYFADGRFHTATGDVRPVKRIALADAPALVRSSAPAASHLTNGTATTAGIEHCREAQGSTQEPCQAPATDMPVLASARTAAGGAAVNESEDGSAAKRPRLDMSNAAAATAERIVSPRACCPALPAVLNAWLYSQNDVVSVRRSTCVCSACRSLCLVPLSTLQAARTCPLSGAGAVRAPAESPSYQLSVGDMELSSDEECMVPLPLIGAPAPAHAQPSQRHKAEARVYTFITPLCTQPGHGCFQPCAGASRLRTR